MDRTTKLSLLKSLSKTKELSVKTGAELLGINRTTLYYTPVGVSDEELECKAIIDWYSRCIGGWELDDTLSTDAVIRALDKALAVATPEIINSDQGCQFTNMGYMNC